MIVFIIKGAAEGGSSGRTAFLMTTLVEFSDLVHSSLEPEGPLASKHSQPVCLGSSTGVFRLRPTESFFPTANDTGLVDAVNISNLQATATVCWQTLLRP